MAKFKRILLKLSGESLMGKQSFGIDPVRLGEYAEQIKEVHEMGVQIGIVIGGGNIFRGLSGASKGFDRVKGDQMGMCATVINSLALSSALGALGVKTKVLTAIRMEPIVSSTLSGRLSRQWRQDMSASSLPEPVRLTSQQTQVRRCAASRLRLT